MCLLRVARNGKEIGQWEEDELVEHLASGQVHLTDYVRWEGAVSWVELGSLVDNPWQRMASEVQKKALRRLGYTGDLESVTEEVAKVWIGHLLDNPNSPTSAGPDFSDGTNGHGTPTSFESQRALAEQSILCWLRHNIAEKSLNLEETAKTIANHTLKIRSGIRQIRDLEVQLSTMTGPGSQDMDQDKRRLQDLAEARRDDIRELEDEIVAEQSKLPGLRHELRAAQRLRMNALMALFSGCLRLNDSDDYIVLHHHFGDLDDWHKREGGKHEIPTPERLSEVVAELDAKDAAWEINQPMALFDAFPLKKAAGK
jgi:hypothetical protein